MLPGCWPRCCIPGQVVRRELGRKNQLRLSDCAARQISQLSFRSGTSSIHDFSLKKPFRTETTARKGGTELRRAGVRGSESSKSTGKLRAGSRGRVLATVQPLLAL